MARAEIEVTRHGTVFRWEAHVEGRVLTGAVPVAGIERDGGRLAQAIAWRQAARAVSRLVSSFKGDS